jgi:hypothetical protein
VSWDLDLVPPEHGDDPHEWLEEAEIDAEAARGHVEALERRFPDFERFGPSEFGYELSMPESSGLPLQVGLYGTHASITVAYWDLGERTEELAERLVGVASALHEETGWVVYDPQDDRVVGLDELADVFGAGHSHGVKLVEQIVAEREEKPKRKRFLGLF